jgi:two-component system response regulator DegU
MNVLIVDDNQQFRKALTFIIKENLADKFDELFEAENGVECLDLVKKHNIDIIFMDKEMPIMNGEEATKRIVDNYRNIKIIAVSFHSELEDIKGMLEAGARNYIIKEEITSDVIAKCLAIT